VLTRGKVSGADLFPAASDPADDWRKLALLWRSQLPVEGWAGLVGTITVNRVWDGDQRDIALRPGENGEWDWSPDLLWNMNVGPDHPHRVQGPDDWSSWTFSSNEWLRNQARFTCDSDSDFLAHALEPLASDLGSAITTVHSYGPHRDRAITAANALITMWLASGQDSPPEELTAAYDTCLNIALHGFAPFDTSTRERFRLLIFRQLAADMHRLPKHWLASAKLKIARARNDDRHQAADLVRIANEVVPGFIPEVSMVLGPPRHLDEPDNPDEIPVNGPFGAQPTSE
jgi:hypothetical protein